MEPTHRTVDPAGLLDQIEARHGTWYDPPMYTGPVAWWPGGLTGEEMADYIGRNDVPRLVAALRAVLDLADMSESGEVRRLAIRRFGEISAYDLRATITTALGGAA